MKNFIENVFWVVLRYAISYGLTICIVGLIQKLFYGTLNIKMATEIWAALALIEFLVNYVKVLIKSNCRRM